MKTSELKTDTVYAFSEKRTWGSMSPVAVVAPELWMHQDAPDHTAPTENGFPSRKIVIAQAPKGWRAGRTSSYRTTIVGVPVLRLNCAHYRWTEQSREDRIAESPQEILARVAEQIDPKSLLGEYSGGERPTLWVEIEAKLVGGGTEMVRAGLTFVRPQDIRQDWDDFIEGEKKALQARAEAKVSWEERKKAADERQEALFARLRALGLEGKDRPFGDGWYELHSNSDLKSHYEIKVDLLESLIALAEKGAEQ